MTDQIMDWRSDYELWRELCGFAKKLVSPFPSD